MPRAAILFFSSTGNTRLACEYVANRIPQVEFDLFDMRDLSGFDPEAYSFVGFATYVDYQAPPRFFAEAVGRIPSVKGKEAFVLLTYAAFPGNGLKEMARIVEERGFKVVIGHMLTMPESYSPIRMKGMRYDDSPKEASMDRFRQFIRDLGDMMVTKELKGSVETRKLKVGLINSLVRKKVRTDPLKGMGVKIVDRTLCTRCGACHRSCAYGAIRMEDGPVFDEGRCNACFACYNHCPVGAITSEKMGSPDHRYPGPSEALRKRMSY
jgi:ferredoxin